MQERTVLFVDDEVNILKALQRLLRSESMKVVTASRPQDAIELLETTPVQVIVTDQRMPEMSGVDLLSTIRERHPDMVRMMLTGYTEMTIAVEAINRGEIYRLITKPWNDDELKATLKQAFGGARGHLGRQLGAPRALHDGTNPDLLVGGRDPGWARQSVGRHLI